MTSVKIPYIQDKYNPITLTMEKGINLLIEQSKSCIVIDDIFEFIGKLNYLINTYQFRTLKNIIKNKNKEE